MMAATFKALSGGIAGTPEQGSLTGKSRSRSLHLPCPQVLVMISMALLIVQSLTPDYEVDALIAARIAGKSDEEIRALVIRLEAARKELA